MPAIFWLWIEGLNVFNKEEKTLLVTGGNEYNHFFDSREILCLNTGYPANNSSAPNPERATVNPCFLAALQMT